MKLKDYKFGKANAETEYLLTPIIFEQGFYDSRNIIPKLLDDYEFMVIGRKGVGKSAFSAKIMSLASNSTELIAEPINLNEFEFTTFAKANISDDVVGTRKYKDSWDFTLLISIYKTIYNVMKIHDVAEFNHVIELLDQVGFNINNTLRKQVSVLSKIKVGTNIKLLDVALEKELTNTSYTFLDRINTLNVKMIDTINSIYFNNQKVVLLIDGLDDILRFKKNRLEILSSLIRSSEYLNKLFLKNKVPIKIILFIREDIISAITDPDFNKIKRDGGISLSWYNRISELKSMLDLRFKISGVRESEIENWWYKIFPTTINKKDSWTFIIDHTLGKPRDILQFMLTCADTFPENEALAPSEVKVCLKTYSVEYFLEEMRNELAGFIDDSIINALPSVLRRIGGRNFNLNTFTQIQNQQLTGNRNISEDDIKYTLLLLFEAGYIGQLIPTQSYIKGRTITNTNVIFKYRNSSARIDYSEKFIIHKGLYNALDIRN